MNYNFLSQKTALLVFVFLSISVANYAAADDSFNSIGGYNIGQLCTGGEFTKSDSYVLNPDNSSDTIKVKRNSFTKKLKDGYDLKVSCGLKDNKVCYLSLTSDNSDDISVIKDTLTEKMGRPADNSDKTSIEPTYILGLTIDGCNMESEDWFLNNSTTATAYTNITIPYGTSSIDELKWRGGIELSVNDINLTEWKYLKQQGSVSSKEAEALTEEKRKDRVRDLLK